jgi:hypothetical protein
VEGEEVKIEIFEKYVIKGISGRVRSFTTVSM